MLGIAPWMMVVVGLISLLAVVTTAWSVSRDLRAYRAWRSERTAPPPRWKRRQRQKAGLDDDDTDAQRWGWRILALQCAAFGFVVGVGGVVAGYLTRRGWLMVTGGNMFILSVIIWVAYQLVLPKPSALRSGGRLEHGADGSSRP